MQERLCLHVFVAALALLAHPAGAAPLANRLADHPSAYLALHGADPVHWQLWGEPAVSRARRENKLLYVSSGYFSCHWCHVMQQESYRDPGVAQWLNEHFIPVKVDRELSPALDARLIDFVERTNGLAGWPLNVLVTPEGYPLVGFVYLPRDDLLALLREVTARWARSGDALKGLARDASARLSGAAAPAPDDTPLTGERAAELKAALLEQVRTLADDLQGGFGEENKFPAAPQLSALLQIYAMDPSRHDRLGKFLRLTLDQMATQGLWDHLGGGFFRYTVDPGWQIPHFEKMLYDNALLARLYLQAAAVLREPRYEQVARRTLDFMLDEMALPSGAFAASLSAVDDEGVEGGYYLWERAQVAALLSEPEYRAASLAWGLEDPPDLEGGHHLRQRLPTARIARDLGLPERAVRSHLASAREKLLAARARRRLPRDDKVLTAWNALALSALACAAGLPEAERYAAAAARLSRFLTDSMWREGRLRRAVADRNAVGEAALEDYAYLSRALRDAAAARRRPPPALSAAIAEAGWEAFYTGRGWRLGEERLLRYGAPAAVLPDGSMPSPSAVLLELSLELPALRARARAALGRGLDVLKDQAFDHASHVAATLRAAARGAGSTAQAGACPP